MKYTELFIEGGKKGFLPAMKILVKYHSVDPTAQNNNTFLWAAKNGHLHVLEWLWSLRLPENGSFKIDSTQRNNIAFIWAARDGHLHVLKWLLTLSKEEGIAIDATSLGNAAYRYAAENDRHEVVEFLESIGAVP